MTVVSFAEEINITNQHDFLLRLKNFAQSIGWTIVEFQQNVQWTFLNPNYGFAAGDHTYLVIESNGVGGSQHLHFRFKSEQTGATTDNEYIHYSAFFPPGPNPIDFTSPTDPVLQTGYFFQFKRGIRDSLMDKAWFFGNAGFICAIAKLDLDFVQIYLVGSPRPYKATEAELNYINFDVTVMPWTNKAGQAHSDLGRYVLYVWEGVHKKIRQTHFDNGSSGIDSGFYFYDFEPRNPLTPAKNQWSGLRPMFKNVIYAVYSSRAPADGKARPVGVWDFYHISDEDFQPGEKIIYGTKEFLVFPPRYSVNSASGLAFRIA